MLKGRGDPETTKASRYVAERTWALNSDPNNLALAQELEWAKLQLLPQCGSKDEIMAMAYHAGWTKAELINLKNGINQSEDKNGNPITLMPNWCVAEVKQTLASLDNDFSWLQATPDVAWPIKSSNGKSVSPLWTGKGYEQKAATLPTANNHPYDPGNSFGLMVINPNRAHLSRNPAQHSTMRAKPRMIASLCRLTGTSQDYTNRLILNLI